MWECQCLYKVKKVAAHGVQHSLRGVQGTHTHTLMSTSILFHDSCALIAFYIGFYLYCNHYLPYIFICILIFIWTLIDSVVLMLLSTLMLCK